MDEVIEIEHSYAYDKKAMKTQRKQEVKLRVEKLVNEHLQKDEIENT